MSELKELEVIKEFVSSTIGKKYLMAVMGLVWVGFVAAHMAGNLLIFVGSDAYNLYSHALVTNKAILFAEAVMAFSLLAHVVLGVSLTLQNKKAKPLGYAEAGSKSKGASLASKTMAIHGIIILIFIVSHLLTFKFGTVYETTIDGVPMRDIHRLVVEVFKQPIFMLWHMIAVVLLGVHLSHGAKSIFQTLGLLHPSYDSCIRKFACGYSVIVTIGFLAQPIYVFLFA